MGQNKTIDGRVGDPSKSTRDGREKELQYERHLMIGGYENPVGGYLIRAPDPPGNLLTTRSYSIVRRNEYAGSDLIPYGWEPCPPEEGRTALGLLKDFVNRLEVRE